MMAAKAILIVYALILFSGPRAGATGGVAVRKLTSTAPNAPMSLGSNRLVDHFDAVVEGKSGLRLPQSPLLLSNDENGLSGKKFADRLGEDLGLPEGTDSAQNIARLAGLMNPLGNVALIPIGGHVIAWPEAPDKASGAGVASLADGRQFVYKNARDIARELNGRTGSANPIVDALKSVVAAFSLRARPPHQGALRIKAARPGDAKSIIDLSMAVENREFLLFYPLAVQKSWGEDFLRVLSDWNSPSLILTIRDSADGIYGTGALTPIIGEPGAGGISSLYIESHLRGKGFARTIMAELLSAANSFDYRRLYIKSHNPIAAAFYKRLGFEVMYAAPFGDALMMMLLL